MNIAGIAIAALLTTKIPLQSAFRVVFYLPNIIGGYSSDEKENDQLYLVGTYWGVNKDSENLDTVKDFINWLVTSDEGKECMTKTLQLIPAYNNMEADADSIGTLGKAVSDYMAAGKVDNIYYTFYPDGFAQAAGEAVQKLGAGRSTNEEFLQELQDAWDNLSK